LGLHRLVSLLILAFLTTASGCLGPLAIRHSRAKYNAAIQRTSDEQLLLNLVRLRYRDTPSFIELSSLSTQFAFGETAFANGRLIERTTTNDFLNIGAALDASERPTVTYDPLRGQEFVKRLISPLSEETIILVIRSGWSVERVLRMTAQELNGVENARRASGPTPDTISREEFVDFNRVVRALRDLQVARETSIGYEDRQEAISGPIAPEALNADAIVSAAKEGWRIEPRHERVMVALSKIKSSSKAAAYYQDRKLLKNFQEQIKLEKLRTPLRLTFDSDPDPENEEQPFTIVPGELGDLRLIAYQEHFNTEGTSFETVLVPSIVEYPDHYFITGPTQSLILSWSPSNAEQEHVEDSLRELPAAPPFETGRYELEIEPRSLMGTLYYLSHAIRVPSEHEAAGLVSVTMTDNGEVFDWAELTGDLLSVNCSRRKPSCASVAVPYRGYWFYIDDRDQESKASFTLLMQLFELQAGGGASGTKPVLTLPVGL